ncbi:hypothetical protein HU200_061338 [Digitaria exilis]|uniref:Uncharacterized protein n=1 Tax=Digitaria exilis TaxID=1010633 RepID=A0A835E1E4_9POAL|nr:hypothetical protein HU200_061338 [Digitaria exilis]
MHLKGVNSSKVLKEVEPSTGPWSTKLLQHAGKLKLFEDDPTLRRSCRKIADKKGCKGLSCADRKYIACGSNPPIISAFIIKTLWATFCNVDPEKLTDPALLKKKKASIPGGKKPILKKKTKEDDDRIPKKKSKK